MQICWEFRLFLNWTYAWMGWVIYLFIYLLNFSCSCPFHLVENWGPCSNDMVNFYGNRPLRLFSVRRPRYNMDKGLPKKKKAKMVAGTKRVLSFFPTFSTFPFLISPSFRTKLLSVWCEGSWGNQRSLKAFEGEQEGGLLITSSGPTWTWTPPASGRKSAL